MANPAYIDAGTFMWLVGQMFNIFILYPFCIWLNAYALRWNRGGSLWIRGRLVHRLEGEPTRIDIFFGCWCIFWMIFTLCRFSAFWLQQATAIQFGG